MLRTAPTLIQKEKKRMNVEICVLIMLRHFSALATQEQLCCLGTSMEFLPLTPVWAKLGLYWILNSKGSISLSQGSFCGVHRWTLKALMNYISCQGRGRVSLISRVPKGKQRPKEIKNQRDQEVFVFQHTIISAAQLPPLQKCRPEFWHFKKYYTILFPGLLKSNLECMFY